MKVTVRHRQTLSDVAMAVYGDVSGIAALAEANRISMTDDLIPGVELECPEVVYDGYMQAYCKARMIQPATAADPDGEIRMKIFTQQFTEQYQ